MRYKRLELGQYDIPGDAISLIEDIQSLERIRELLATIRERSVSNSAIEARQMLRRIGFLIAALHTVAEENLRQDYLAGRPIKRGQKRQSLADIWQILMDGRI